MKRAIYIMFGFLVIGASGAGAQQVIAPAGGTGQNTNGTLCYTVGELAIDTRTVGNTTLTQGLHQPLLIVTPVDETQGLQWSVTVIPNPASDRVVLTLINGKPGKTTYALYHINGKLVGKGPLHDGVAEISFAKLQPATYLIKVWHNGTEVKNIKIVKQ